MAYVLQPDDADVAAGVRRVALARFDAALDALGDDTIPVDRKVHAGRRHLKAVRALMRLLRPLLPDHRAHDVAMRDAGRIVADLRDSMTMVTVVDRFADLLIGTVGKDSAVSLRAAMAQEAERRLRADDVPGILQRFKVALLSRRDHATGWPTEMDRSMLEHALARTYRKTQQALAVAAGDSRHGHAHEVRKTLVHHRVQIRLLRPVMPGPLEAHLALADTLSDGLADMRDAEFLDAILSQQDDVIATDALRSARSALQAERNRLQPLLTDIATVLTAETPQGFARRVGTYHDVWRAGRLRLPG